jgi:Flp pilus assembly protein TadG
MRRRGERGQMVPLMALFFVVLIGAMAIATDLSVSTHYKRNLSNIADAAALAGAALLPAAPALSDEQAATAAAITLLHNSIPWTPNAGASVLAASGCSGSQCSVTVCAGMTSATSPCTTNVTPPTGSKFVLTVNAPPKTAVVDLYNHSLNDPDYKNRIEVVLHQQSGAFFTGLFGSSSDQDGAQSIAFHYAPNQPFPFALFSSTVIGDGNAPEIINGNVYAARYLAPQSDGQAGICAAPWVDSQGNTNQGFVVLGAPQGPDAGYAGDGQSGNSKVPPGSDPILNGLNCSAVVAGTVGMSAIPGSTAGCQAAYPGNNGAANIVYDSMDQACEANPAMSPPAVASPPYIPVYSNAQTYCGTQGLSGNTYQPGDYTCPNGSTSLTIDHAMTPGIYEIEAGSNSGGCDVSMDGSITQLTGVTFYLKGGASICANPPSGTTITQTPFNSGSGSAGDGRYAILSDNVGNPTITMNTGGSGSTSGVWSVYGVIWLPTGTVNIGNKDALADSGQVIVNTWNDTSGFHQNPSVTYNAGYAPPQFEKLQLVE